MPKKKFKQSKVKGSPIPAGFESASTGQFAPSWDFQKRKELLGVVMQKKTVVQERKNKGKTEKRNVTVLIVADANGEMLTVWESKALEELCGKAMVGDQVYIRFDGFVKIKGRPQPMKAFTTAIKKKGKK